MAGQARLTSTCLHLFTGHTAALADVQGLAAAQLQVVQHAIQHGCIDCIDMRLPACPCHRRLPDAKQISALCRACWHTRCLRAVA